MGKVARRKVGRKAGVRRTPAVAVEAASELDSRIELIQAFPADRRYDRWGRERGSVYLADQKVPVIVPRVRDVHDGREVRLPSYDRLQTPRDADGHLLARRPRAWTKAWRRR